MTSVLKTQEIGGVVDDFTLQKITGGEQSLSASLTGKRGAVVIFWSGVCSHCTRYDEFFNTFEERHPELTQVIVASRHGETQDQIRKTCAERALTVPILHDPGGLVAKRWFTQQTPRAFLIDVERALLYRGAIDNYKYPGDPQHLDYLEPAIAEFLDGHPVLRAETASFGCAIQSVYYLLPKNL